MGPLQTPTRVFTENKIKYKNIKKKKENGSNVVEKKKTRGGEDSWLIVGNIKNKNK